MDFTDVIHNRRSHRKFATDKVPEEVLKRIFEATVLAPTWSNKQGVRYLIVDDPAQIEKVADAGQKWLKNVPMIIVAFIHPKDSGENTNNLKYFPVDAAIGLHQLILAATNEGLGTCWIGFFNEEETKKVLKLPEKTRIIGMTPLGYSRYEPRDIERAKIEEIVFRNEYGMR